MRGLSDHEKKILQYCYRRREMVERKELVVYVSGLAEGHRIQWFDERWLRPEEKRIYTRVRSAVSRSLRILFEQGYIDIGNEGTYGEGIKTYYRRIWKAQQNKSYWLGEYSPEFIERTIAFSKEIMETKDFDFAKEQLGGKIELVGLTEEGVAKARELEEGPTSKV